MTHLACADERDGRATAAQLARFREATQGLSYETSIVNSAGLLAEVAPDTHWVRPGLALYGASPFEDTSAEKFGLRPVMTLTSTVLTVRHVGRGEAVGYGGTWKAERDCRIAIIAAGYGDGVHRSFATGTPVLLRGQRATLVGRVSMDDRGGCQRLRHRGRNRRGALGEGCRWREVARHAGTIPLSCCAAWAARSAGAALSR
jgi:alanine racemase